MVLKKYKIVQNSSNDLKWAKTVNDCKNGSNASIWSNIVQNGVKWFKIVLYNPKLYKIF